MLVEDMEIIMSCLRERRRWIEVDLDLNFHQGSKPTELRLELARVNAEISKRCWNRLLIRAAARAFAGGKQ